MLTHYIGNITYVEPGQIIVVVGKTTDAATRYPISSNQILILIFHLLTHCYQFQQQIGLELPNRQK